MDGLDPLTEESLRASLKTHSFGHPLYSLLTIDSTNDYAKRAAARGASEGTLVVSEEQTGGRGRRGRSWFSPPGTAILMSLVLRPELEPVETAGITLITAVAVSEAVFKITGFIIFITDNQRDDFGICCYGRVNFGVGSFFKIEKEALVVINVSVKNCCYSAFFSFLPYSATIHWMGIWFTDNSVRGPSCMRDKVNFSKCTSKAACQRRKSSIYRT